MVRKRAVCAQASAALAVGGAGCESRQCHAVIVKFAGFALPPRTTNATDMKSPHLPCCWPLPALALPVAGRRREPRRQARSRQGTGHLTQVCGACHTADGSRGSPANPIMRASTPSTWPSSWHEFKSGKRNNPIMKGFASTLSRQRHARTSPPSTPASRPSPALRRTRTSCTLGEKIYRGGIADKQRAGLRRLPQPERRRHPGAVPAHRRPARRLHRGPAQRLSLRPARQQRADGRASRPS